MEQSITLYQKHFNLETASFSRIDHEDTIVAVVYKILTESGQEYVLKICHCDDHFFREFYFLKYFASKLPVPKILNAFPPQEGIYGAVLMEYIPGELLKIEDYTESLSYEVGKNLALIHQNRLPGYGDLLQDKLSNNPKEYFTSKFKKGLEECRPKLSQKLMNASLKYFNEHIHLLESVDGPCIVHRDFRPGNLIIRNNKLQGIIDWSGTKASFAEEDFCTLEHRDWITNPKSKQGFLSGYSSIRSIPKYDNLLPLLRLSKAINTMGFIVKRNAWDTTSTHLYEFNHHFLDNFINKLNPS